MERINEMLFGVLAVVGGFLTKRIFSRQDRLEEKTEERIQHLEKIILTKSDIEPLEKSVEMILTHILSNTKK